jgi:sugar phosphate isomerase/epimerase
MTSRKLSISECTTWPATFEEDLAAYTAAGAHGIGIWEFKLPPGRDEEMLARLRETPLQASLCISMVPSPLPDPFFTEPRDPRDRIEAMAGGIRRLARFEPDGCILVLAGAPLASEADEGWSIAVEGLRKAAAVAAAEGVKLGLEPLRKTSGTVTPSLDATARMLDQVGDERVGMIFDTWHFWDHPQVHDALRRYAARITGVQVNDWREPTRSWCDRVLPGDGVIDFPPMVEALEEGGYQGWYDLEVFSDDGRYGNDFPDSVWKRDVSEVAAEGVRRFQHLWPRR